jgi:hypothetical protein
MTNNIPSQNSIADYEWEFIQRYQKHVGPDAISVRNLSQIALYLKENSPRGEEYRKAAGLSLTMADIGSDGWPKYYILADYRIWALYGARGKTWRTAFYNNEMLHYHETHETLFDAVEYVQRQIVARKKEAQAAEEAQAVAQAKQSCEELMCELRGVIPTLDKVERYFISQEKDSSEQRQTIMTINAVQAQIFRLLASMRRTEEEDPIKYTGDTKHPTKRDRP